MNQTTETSATEQVSTLAATPAAPLVAPDREVVPLPDVLRQITRDSQRDAAAYLAETRVRYGGE